MANPFVKSRVVFKRSGATLYDLTNVATDFDLHMTLNDVDLFNFTLPTLLGATSRPYLDLQLFDDVFLYVGQTTIPGTPLLAGKVVKITSQAQDTVTRTFFCKDLIEVAERRFKSKYYGAVTIHDIIAELAGDLGWGVGSIGTEATPATENFDGISYLELIKRLSDYWVSGTTNVKKDFKVDASGNLVWGDRPLRTVGVSLLLAGQGLMKPVVHWDIETVKNAVRVYGNASRTEPDATTNLDGFSEALTDWTLDAGLHLTLDSDCKVKNNSIYGVTDSLLYPDLEFTRALSPSIYCGNRKDGFMNLHVWLKADGTARGADLENSINLATTGSNVFKLDFTKISPFLLDSQWHEMNFAVGPDSPYWTEGGVTPDPNHWNDPVDAIQFKCLAYGITGWLGLRVDGLWFTGGRFKSDETTDPTSITAYGRRESVTVDDKLLSDAECLNRQKSLLFMYKDPIPTVTCPVPLDLNLLAGDRLILTVPSENIVSSPFDLVSVRHLITAAYAQTQISAVGTANTRYKPAMNAIEAIAQRFERQDLINRGVLQR